MDVEYRPAGEERAAGCASSGKLERELNELILEHL